MAPFITIFSDASGLFFHRLPRCSAFRPRNRREVAVTLGWKLETERQTSKKAFQLL